MKIVVFCDVETTGLPRYKKGAFYDPKHTDMYDGSRIIEVACSMYEIDEINKTMFFVKSYSTLVHSNHEFDVKNTFIHGITTEHVLSHGEKASDVIEFLFNQYFKPADELVAHNINFDFNILASECYRHQRTDVADHLISLSKKCTMLLGQTVFKLKKYPKLAELAELIDPNGAEVKQEHRAMSDVNICATCYMGMHEYVRK